MNQHKRAWLFLFILTILFSCCSVAVFATEITPEQVQQIIDAQSAASNKAAVSKAPASSLATNSTSSSKKPVTSRRTYASSFSSTESALLSSDGSSAFSSEEASSEIILPSVGSVQENNPLSSVIVDSAANQKMKWVGILSWICIALGIIVVLIVVFSNRRPPNGGSGRKRYRRAGHSNKKRLLNEKYYRHTKY